ncbi:MAG: type II toxin-antitoxin system VapC family toxin [Gammaproteobacteria bacterium]|nr:type II toxin-antitoxin system VapC family toxin [Gammaproteobacteria bacterium]
MKKILIDTHVFLWWISDNKNLGENARKYISNPQNRIYLSSVSSWEISIKKNKGLLEAPDDIASIVNEEGFEELPISIFHGELAGKLESIHKDPFDRMMIAQAKAEAMELLTDDLYIKKYSISIIDASK